MRRWRRSCGLHAGRLYTRGSSARITGRVTGKGHHGKDAEHGVDGAATLGVRAAVRALLGLGFLRNRLEL
jgi:hypothetical protein